MKRNALKSIFLVVILFSFAFFGCSMAEDVVVSDVNSSMDMNRVYGTLNFQTSRTIMMADDDSRSYDFYIYGTNSSNGNFPITKIDVESSTGKFSVMLGSAYWNLTVFALNSGDPEISDTDLVYSNALLIGKAAADLTNSSASAAFTMSVSNLQTDGYASFNLILSNDSGNSFWTLPTDEQGRAYRVRGSIRNMITGSLILCTNESNSSSEVAVNFGNVDGSGKYQGTYNPTYGLHPGTYMFQLDFYNGDIDHPVFKGCWTDTIVIPAGRTLVGDFYIPNVLGKKPAAPENFYASYYRGSEDSSEHEGTYKLHFNWEDKANNETHFELELAEVNMSWDWETDSWTNGRDETYITSSTVFDKSYFTHTEFVEDSGSLNANSSRISIYAKLGVQYQARIRAVNNFGASDWVNVQMATSSSVFTDTDKTLLSYFGADYGDGSHSSNCMHRGRIVYYVMDGSYAPVNADLRISSPKFQYFTQMTPNLNTSSQPSWWSGIPLWDGSGCDGTDSTVLKDGTKKFRYWNTSQTAGAYTRIYDSEGTNTGYQRADNLILYAEYEDDASLVDTKTYKLLASWIKKTIDAGSPVAITTDPDSRRAVVSLNKTTDHTVRLSIAVPQNELPGDYTKISMDIMNSKNLPLCDTTSQVYNSSGNTFLLDLDNAMWVKGIYEITFTAEKAASGSSLYEKCYITLIVD